MLEVNGVAFNFESQEVLRDVSFKVDRQETLAILGPSGCGKSTLLNIIAGLLTPSSGTVVIDGRDQRGIATHRRNIGYVFQDNQLFPHLNVEQNIEFGLKLRKVPKSSRKEIVGDLLETIGLKNAGQKKVQELSGGEAKRVALARSLAPKPKILLLDEPLTGLDNKLHDQLSRDLKKILCDSKTTTVFVTHNEDEANLIANNTFRLR